MLVNSQRNPLHHIIIEDVLSSNKLVLILLFAIVVTALGTVWMTNQTRKLVSENGDLMFAKQALENEYINQQVQQATLADHARIEGFARSKFGMGSVTPEQEVIIYE